jgi:hypothetical protein
VTGAVNQQLNQCGDTVQCLHATVAHFQTAGSAMSQANAYAQQQQLAVNAQIAQQTAQMEQQQQSGGFWGGLASFVHAIAPVMTILALATFALPGVDVLTGALAFAVQAVNLASVGFDVASFAVSAHSAYEDIQGGASGLQTGLDIAGAITSLAGAGAGGMALRSASSAAAAEGTFTAATRSAIHSEYANLIASNYAGMNSFLAGAGN